MNFLAYAALRFYLHVFFLFITVPVLLVMGLLIYLAGSHESLKFLVILPIVMLLVWIVGVHWAAETMANAMFFEDKTFWPAFRCTCSEAKFNLGFLPVVGRFFVPKEKADPMDNDVIEPGGRIEPPRRGGFDANDDLKSPKG